MKASKRRRADRNSQQAIEAPPAQPAFTDDEEAFFREGAELSAASSEAFAELDDGPVRRPSLWRRLFGRGERGARGSLADA